MPIKIAMHDKKKLVFIYLYKCMCIKKKVKKRFLISVVAIIDTTLYVFLNVRLKFKNNLCLYYILL